MKNLSVLLSLILLSVMFISTTYAKEDPKEELTELRSQIDILDKQILELINKRAEVVLEIGELKKRNELGVYDPKREKQIEKNLAEMNDGPMPDASVIEIFRTIISASRELQ